ncbi:VOC family protein [Streptomyces sp. NPDC055681]
MTHDVVRRVEEAAEQLTERLGRLADESVKLVREAGVMRLLQPTDVGGTRRIRVTSARRSWQWRSTAAPRDGCAGSAVCTDEVGQALDRILAAGYHLSSTLGRHTNDKMVSFYVRTPGGWDLEVGVGGLLVDEDSYTAEEITADSYWGHHWTSADLPPAGVGRLSARSQGHDCAPR